MQWRRSKKFSQPRGRGPLDYARHTDRGMVPGRDERRAEEQAHLSLGQKGLTPLCHPRSTYRIDLLVRCGLPRARDRRRWLINDSVPRNFFRIRGINRRFARSSSRKLNRFCHKEIIQLGAIERPVISKTECLKIVRWSIRNATLCVEHAVRAQDSHAKEWFAKGAIYWRDIAAYWLQVCEMHQARESSAYTVS